MKPHPSEIESPPDALDSAWTEYLRGIDSGQPVDREKFLLQCGDQAGLLRELLRTADLIERMAGPRQCDEFYESAESNASTEARSAQAPSPPDERRNEATDRWPKPMSPDETQPFLPDGSAAPDTPTRSLSADHRASSATAPERLGEYELLTEIGRGGMGVVYKARQSSLDRIVADKMILAGRFASSDDVQRFYTEAQAAAKLDHPNVVAIYQVGEIEGHHYFSMDFIEGTDLASMIAAGPLAPELAARYLAQVADAVEYAHRKGILHRDLKPANVLIDDLDRPLISDFGLAKYLGQHEGLTASGLAIGTPSYMSPEQAEGRQTDIGPTADVYALGAILYAMLTGGPPHRGDTPVDTILKVIHQDPLPPSEINSSLRGDLETICLKCLQKDPTERYSTAKELADDLRRYLRDEPVDAKPASPLVKTTRWILNMPLVAALAGRRVLEPTVAHRRVQTALLAVTMLVPLLFFGVFAVSRIVHNRLPRTIRIAAGQEDGFYHDFSSRFAEALGASTQRPVEIITTTGSGDNRQAVLNHDSHLALLQANAVRGPAIAVIAPLYYEVVHVLVRRDRDIGEIKDLTGKRVVVGPPGSGSRLSARIMLEHHGLTLEHLPALGESLSQFRDDSTFDAAIITIGAGSHTVQALLESSNFELIPVVDSQRLSLEHAAYRPYIIKAADYGGAKAIPDEGVLTVATTAFLAARADAPDILVTTALDILYSPDSTSSNLISREFAAEWQGLALHPAARRYYESIVNHDG
ncbi:MAG: TAXI family TRAP transporter solute-binding subunit [Planctomycetales bacterium]|nr:TAXI family TRAP transporter solute-binding subunit [Planctomycetales bacterium]